MMASPDSGPPPEMDALLEDKIEERLAVLRQGWQRQALEKIKEAELKGFERGRAASQEPATAPSEDNRGLIEAAEARGVEKGRRAEEAERGKWQAVAEAYMPPPTGPNPTLLLKLVMEQVYRECKKEFAESPDVIARMKSVLHASNDALTNKLPPLLLPPPAAPMPTPAPTIITQAAPPTRPYKFCLGTVAPALSQLVLVDITGTSEHARPKGLFSLAMASEATFTSYTLSLRAYVINPRTGAPSLEPLCLTQQRRHSEFQHLYRDLRKEFPFCIISPIPAVPKTVPGAAPHDIKEARRRRLLTHWLQYVYHHGSLQSSAALLAFVSGGGSMTERDSLGMYRGAERGLNAGHKGQGQGRGQGQDGRPRVQRDDALALSLQSKIALLSPPQPAGEVYSSTLFARELAMRDVAAVQRATLHLDLSLTQLVEAAKRLFFAHVAGATAFYGASHAFNVMASIEEKHGGCEAPAWKAMSRGFSENAPLRTACSVEIEQHLVEPASLLSSCMPATQQVLDSTRTALQSPALDESEKLDVAVGMAREWDAARRIRCTVLLDELMLLCRRVAASHGEAARSWTHARAQLTATTPEIDANLQRSNAALREAVSAELGGLDGQLSRLQGEFCEQQEMQGAFVKITSAIRGADRSEREAGVAGAGVASRPDAKARASLGDDSGRGSLAGSDRWDARDDGPSPLSHKHLLRRAVVPPGTRREPTPAELSAGIGPLHEAVDTAAGPSATIAGRGKSAAPRGSATGGGSRGSSGWLESDDDETRGSGSWDAFDSSVARGRDAARAQPSPLFDLSPEDEGAPPPPPKKEKFGWSDLLWRSNRPQHEPDAGVKEAPRQANNAERHDMEEEDGDEEEEEEDQHQGEEHKEEEDEEEEEEDTPMNRACRQREESYARKREAEEQRQRDRALDDSRKEASAQDGIYERRTRRAAQHGHAATATRRPKARTAAAPEDLYVPSPKPAEAVRGPAGTHEAAGGYFEKVPSGPVGVSVAVPRRGSGPGGAGGGGVASTPQPKQQPQQQPQQQQPQPQPQPQPQVQQQDLPNLPTHTAHPPALPLGWEAVRTSEGSTYYYHKLTRISRWDYPSEQVQAALQERLQEAQKKEEAAAGQRRAEREAQQRAQQQQAAEADRLQSATRAAIVAWRGVPRPRSLPELLSTLHTLTPVVSQHDVCPVPLTDASPPSDVKRAYFKAAKALHPDKLSADLPLDTRLLAEASFVVLSELWEVYRTRL